MNMCGFFLSFFFKQIKPLLYHLQIIADFFLSYEVSFPLLEEQRPGDASLKRGAG
jgi:hypothetical protein